jgi:hypothetical protein
MNADDNNNDVYGDSDFLAQRDKTVNDFRASDKDTKRKIIEKMFTLRHNMKYNKHLLSVYTRAKALFDTMVEEHRAQLTHLDEIYRHVNNLIRENLSARRNKRQDNGTKIMMTELVKDKKRIGALLKKMRGSFDKLMDIDTVIGTTIEKINEITFMDEDEEYDDKEVDIESADDYEDDVSEDSEESEDSDDSDDSDDIEESEDSEDSEESEDSDDIEESEDSDDIEDSEDSDDSEESEESDDDSDEEYDDIDKIDREDRASEDENEDDNTEEDDRAKKPVIYVF